MEKARSKQPGQNENDLLMARIQSRRRAQSSDSESETERFAPGVVNIGIKASAARNTEVTQLQDLMSAKAGGYRPTRDSAMLAVRISHRLYEAVRLVAYVHAHDNLPSAADLTPQLVRNFCEQPAVTTHSALELAASCLELYARPP